MLEHGDYLIRRSKQVILYGGRGPWNDEALLAGSKIMASTIAELNQTQPWAQLSSLFGECLMPPSTFDAFVFHSKVRQQKGLMLLAIVIQQSEVKNTIKQQLGRAYSQVGIEHQFFDSIAQAVDYLAERAFLLEPADLRSFEQDCLFMQT